MSSGRSICATPGGSPCNFRGTQNPVGSDSCGGPQGGQPGSLHEPSSTLIRPLSFYRACSTRGRRRAWDSTLTWAPVLDLPLQHNGDTPVALCVVSFFHLTPGSLMSCAQALDAGPPESVCCANSCIICPYDTSDGLLVGQYQAEHCKPDKVFAQEAPGMDVRLTHQA
eukprot:CAMPEP_0174374182 /NCGR_PEP_ID=MMETSP0811_2-20130205/109954_1 /TAXON_ID=73025 ORGANISM="Eutreptiella gymnastica-like, Strain CCMP1594" /NCGR_SAMPLE_ID=MMETSP0811_2 /ASSEMBLY_ACC=CAM_ASM_000667 /LENGTH=167 /DNA_ID=CAMNT_0015523277 /DNA_START=251 /DNA_END=755 /DNA_ORIENTATION=-